MKSKYPSKILIRHDDHHAQFMGRLSDGSQFFLTTPFIPATHNEGCEFIALYKFNSNGEFLSAQIEKLGVRKLLDPKSADAKFHLILSNLGELHYGDIIIQPFELKKFGVTFGLIPIDSEFVENEDDLCLELRPGNYMAFYPPWDGYYDT
jgi:hypothetical protein